MQCVSSSSFEYDLPLTDSDPLLLYVTRFDDDLLRNSSTPIETLVRVGDSIGRSVLPTAGFDAAEVMRSAEIGPEPAGRFGAFFRGIADRFS